LPWWPGCCSAKKKLLIAGLAINLAIVGLVYHWPQVIATVNPEKQAKLNPFKRAMGWDALGRQLKPILLAHSDSVLIADNRTLLAHMLYELRDIKPAAASWNPSGVASDHYKLTTDLRPYVGKNALLITDTAPGADVAPALHASKARHAESAARRDNQPRHGCLPAA
jgi:hypothetical protein